MPEVWPPEVVRVEDLVTWTGWAGSGGIVAVAVAVAFVWTCAGFGELLVAGSRMRDLEV